LIEKEPESSTNLPILWVYILDHIFGKTYLLENPNDYLKGKIININLLLDEFERY